MTSAMHSRLPTGQSFAEELKEDFAGWARATGIDVELWALPDEPLPPDVQKLLRETIDVVFAAIAEHARARTVSIALIVARSGVRLTIGDDGPGMPVGDLRHRLSPVRAAMAALGGGLTVTNVVRRGTTVTGGIPCRPGSCSRGASR
ncbi:hypothetical protein [Nonomuraea sp. NPDC050786]|uniref:hypothetical protein n=1 Tax=Nonomuraea sp. NPDC050786 TaxID=3154840 RepID=UPI0033F5839D